eukprot:TRINITY_DN10444_c0_g1_i2.p1 TRINITY_DN10444_c0_g1~~TRINITY_DN10444_c0_g1_i2.p1  ORF type:complete len:129 (-),score=30.46 TRINITY_DN10444_c0_g1_i2:146-532(-)
MVAKKLKQHSSIKQKKQVIKHLWNFSEIYINTEDTMPHPTEKNLYNISVIDTCNPGRNVILSIPLNDSNFFKNFQERMEVNDTKVFGVTLDSIVKRNKDKTPLPPPLLLDIPPALRSLPTLTTYMVTT